MDQVHYLNVNLTMLGISLQCTISEIKKLPLAVFLLYKPRRGRLRRENLGKSPEQKQGVLIPPFLRQQTSYQTYTNKALWHPNHPSPALTLSVIDRVIMHEDEEAVPSGRSDRRSRAVKFSNLKATHYGAPTA